MTRPAGGSRHPAGRRAHEADPERPAAIRVLGVRVDPWTPDAMRRHLVRLLATHGPPATIYSVNPEGVMMARRDEAFAAALERGTICLCDGVGVAVAARMRGLRAPRVPGADLVVDAAEACASAGRAAYLLGGVSGVGTAAAKRLQARVPGLRVQAHAPPFSPTHRFGEDVEETIARRLRAFRPALLCVAFGQPKQERWIDEHLPMLADAGIRVVLAVGGGLDFLAGTQRRAPAPVRRAGLEWAWRLAREPEARASRQARALPAFVRRAIIEAVRRR